MKDESEPISDDEWLLRRVYFDDERIKSGDAKSVSVSAFEPRKGRIPDTDGISLFREACLDSPLDVLKLISEEKRNNCGIVRIQVESLKRLGLSVLLAPIDSLKGHVVIPELNITAYLASKASFNDVRKGLVQLANDNIVLLPGEKTP